MEAVKSFKKRKYTARLTASFLKTWWEPTVLWTHENQGVKHRTSMKKLRFLVGQEQRGHWAQLEHNPDTYQVTRCREIIIITLTFLGRVYATKEIMSEEIIAAFSETHWGYVRWDQWFYILFAEKQILKLRATVKFFCKCYQNVWVLKIMEIPQLPLNLNLLNDGRFILFFLVSGGKNTPNSDVARASDEFQIQAEKDSSSIHKGKVVKRWAFNVKIKLELISCYNSKKASTKLISVWGE